MTPVMALLLTYVPVFVAAVLAFAADAFDRRGWAVGLAVLGLLVSGAAGLWAAFVFPGASFADLVRFGGPFSAVPGVVMVCAALALVGGWSEYTSRPGGGSAAGLVASLALASAGVAASNNLVLLLLCLEIAAAASYALVADARTKRADESAMKYFIQGAIATALFVLGLAVLVGVFAPTASLDALGTALDRPVAFDAALVGVLLIICALAFKMAATPFSAWAPDAYESARPEVAAVLSGVPKLGAIGALALFAIVASSGELAPALRLPLAAFSVLSVLVGSVGALRQASYTRMLGYASVAQAGYALIGIAVMGPTAAVFFGATYAVATVGTFVAATAFARVRPEWDGSITGLAGIGRVAPRTAVGLSLLLVSLAGIPPFLGFWGKLQVFGSAILSAVTAFGSAGDRTAGIIYVTLAAAGIIGSVISLAYYSSVLRAMYFDESPDAEETRGAESGAAAWTVLGLGLAVLVLGLVPLVFGVTSLLLPFVVR